MSNKKMPLFFFFTFFSLLTFLNGQELDTCHTVILYLVDKKGVETGLVRTAGCVKPCKGSYTIPIDKTFLGKRETYYDDCSGKWIKIKYYFLGILTRTRRNPIFDDTR